MSEDSETPKEDWIGVFGDEGPGFVNRKATQASALLELVRSDTSKRSQKQLLEYIFTGAKDSSPGDEIRSRILGLMTEEEKQVALAKVDKDRREKLLKDVELYEIYDKAHKERLEDRMKKAGVGKLVDQIIHEAEQEIKK